MIVLRLIFDNISCGILLFPSRDALASQGSSLSGVRRSRERFGCLAGRAMLQANPPSRVGTLGGVPQPLQGGTGRVIGRLSSEDAQGHRATGPSIATISTHVSAELNLAHEARKCKSYTLQEKRRDSRLGR